MTYRNLLTTTRELPPRSNRDGNAPALALPPAPDSPMFCSCPPPKNRRWTQVKGLAAQSPSARRASRRAAQPRSGRVQNSRIRRSAAAQVRCARSGAPSARPDRRGRYGGFAQSSAGGGRPQHSQPPPVVAALATSAGQVRGRAALSRRTEFEPKGDQPQAIAERVKGVKASERDYAVTGSGKTSPWRARRAALRRVQELLP
jgi:hypothetical protein